MKMKKIKIALALILVISFGTPLTAKAETTPLETKRLTEGFSNDLQITENDLEMLSSAYQEGLKAGIEQADNNKSKPQSKKVINKSNKTNKARKPISKPNSKRLNQSRRQKKEQRERRRRREQKVEKKQTTLPKKDFLTKARKTQKLGKKGLGKTRVVRREEQIRDDFFINKPLSMLTANERLILKQNLGNLLDDEVIQVLLDSLEKAEGAGPKILVGKGIGKSQVCKDKIADLNLKSHAAEQNLPTDCFYFNKDVGKISTAFGRFQITYSNWKIFKKYFKFKSFSIKNQGIATLELVRTTNGGKGFIALVKGNIKRALQFGTQPWASSPYSTLKGKKVNILAIANKMLSRNNQFPKG